MGKLMKDVPATRYNLLDNVPSEQWRAQQLKNFEEDAKQRSQEKNSHPNFFSTVGYRRPSLSAAQELEDYMRQAYRQ